jgi:uncharacterized protein (DUF427 family)
MPKRESLYHAYPDYRVDLEPSSARMLASLGGEVVADSRSTLIVRETKLDPVVYFPLEDVRADHLRPTEHQTFCPFKGEASYWTLEVGERVEENSVWGYEDPFQEVAGLKGYVAFYSDRVDLQEL